MAMDGDSATEGGPGGEKRQLSSPDSPPNTAKRREQHMSVFNLPALESGAGAAPATPPPPVAGLHVETPVSGRPNVSISPNRLELLEKSVEEKKVPTDLMDCPFLYRLIMGNEWRIRRCELAHARDIEELKRSHAHDIAELKSELLAKHEQAVAVLRLELLENIPAQGQDVAVVSDGLRDLEAKVNALDTKVDGLEEVVGMVEGSAQTGGVTTQAPPPTPALQPGAAAQAAAAHTNVPAAQVGDINLAEMDRELQRVGGELNNVNHRAKQQRRRVHLEGDQRDQYSRREMLRVTGVPYKQGENTARIMMAIAYDLGVYITEADISVSHRSGRNRGRDPRPILCRFVRRDVKNQILANKKLARDIRTDPDGNPVRIFVDEDLTRMRASVVKKLREDKVPHYTRDGKVCIAKPNSDTEYTLYDFPEDWEKLPWPESVKIEVGVYPRD